MQQKNYELLLKYFSAFVVWFQMRLSLLLMRHDFNIFNLQKIFMILS